VDTPAPRSVAAIRWVRPASDSAALLRIDETIDALRLL
jgi:hypothetical protein